MQKALLAIASGQRKTDRQGAIRIPLDMGLHGEAYAGPAQKSTAIVLISIYGCYIRSAADPRQVLDFDSESIRRHGKH
jgi:hypothetical protein